MMSVLQNQFIIELNHVNANRSHLTVGGTHSEEVPHHVGEPHHVGGPHNADDISIHYISGISKILTIIFLSVFLRISSICRRNSYGDRVR